MADNKEIPAAKNVSAESGNIGSDRPVTEILRVKITGIWKIGTKTPSASQVQNKIESVGSIRRVGFYTENLTAWDSSLLTFLIKISDYCTHNNLAFV